jgi:hypothetical protein
MRKRRKMLATLAGIAIIALLWRELPAIRRYIKMEKM